MSDEQQQQAPALVRTPPQEVVAAEIRKFGAEFVDGAAEKMGAIWGGALAHLPADKRAEAVAERLAGPLADRYRNPEFKPPTLENGQAPSTLRQALARNADRLRPGAVDELATKWAVDMAGKPASVVAGEVVRRLAHRDNHGYLNHYVAPPAHEAKVIDFLSANFQGEMTYGQMEEMARTNGHKLNGMPESQRLMIVARTLRLPSSDLRTQGRSAAMLDHRPAPAPKPAEPARGPDGKFAETPAKPTRRSLSF